MTATANKHFFVHRRQGQGLDIEVAGVKFRINVGEFSTHHNNITLDIYAPKEVKVYRSETTETQRRTYDGKHD